MPAFQQPIPPKPNNKTNGLSKSIFKDILVSPFTWIVGGLLSLVFIRGKHSNSSKTSKATAVRRRISRINKRRRAGARLSEIDKRWFEKNRTKYASLRSGSTERKPSTSKKNTKGASGGKSSFNIGRFNKVRNRISKRLPVSEADKNFYLKHKK